MKLHGRDLNETTNCNSVDSVHICACSLSTLPCQLSNVCVYVVNSKLNPSVTIWTNTCSLSYREATQVSIHNHCSLLQGSKLMLFCSLAINSMASSFRAAKSTQFVYTPSHASSMRDADFTLELIKVRISMFGVFGLQRLNFAKSKCSTFKDHVPLIPHSATAARQAHPVSPVNACAQRHASRAAASRVEDETSFSSGVATGQMRTCYGSHDKYPPRKPSHRISRDHTERGFYML